jgi:hypothetical protein
MHIHTLRLDIPRSTRVYCEGCEVPLRLATGDEARFVTMTETFAHNGPMVGPANIIVVPLDFSLFQEA